MPSDVRYACENDDCPAAGAGLDYDIEIGAEAVCPRCGWMMTGTGGLAVGA